MISPKANKQTQPQIVARPERSSNERPMLLHTAPSQDAVRARAYELYEHRGGEHGQDEHDWLRAEQEMLKPKR